MAHRPCVCLVYVICSFWEKLAVFLSWNAPFKRIENATLIWRQQSCPDCAEVNDYSFLILFSKQLSWYTLSILYYNGTLLQFLGAHQDNAFVLQVVWKGTRAVGVGIATTSKPDDQGFYASYVVARYSPKGNYLGQFATNVGEEL